MRLVYALPLVAVAVQGKGNKNPDEDNRGDLWGPVLTPGGVSRPDEYVGEPDDRNHVNYFNQTYGVNCGTMAGINRIVGGWEEDIVSHPWQTFFQGCDIRNECNSCGASIIGPRWAITAAHCLSGAEPTTNRIRTGFIFGTNNLEDFSGPNKAQFWRDAVMLVMHEEYQKKTGKNDIGLVKNDKFWIDGSNWDFSDPNDAAARGVFPICLPARDFCLGKSANLMATGWGATDKKGRGEKILRGIYLPLLHLAECRIHHGSTSRAPKWKNAKIDATMTCAGAELGVDTCYGDSGGPLIYRDGSDITTLYGATSWGMGCGRTGYPGVFARVSAYRTWIYENSYVNLEEDQVWPGTPQDTSCRDFTPKRAHTVAKPVPIASLTSGKNLVRGSGLFTAYCVQGGRQFKRGPDRGVQKLTFKDPNYCNPNDAATQFQQVGDEIKDGTGNRCWTFHLFNDKAPITIRPCDNKGWQKFYWDRFTGEIIPKRDMAKAPENQQVIRAFVDGDMTATTRSQIPTSPATLLPGTALNAANPGQVKPSRGFISGFCVQTKGRQPARNRLPIEVGKCGAAGPHNTFKFDASTRQIKVAGTNYCWQANPRMKRRNTRSHVKLAKCNKRLKGDMKFVTDEFGVVSPFNNRKLMIQMTRKKKVQVVSKFDKGFVVSFGSNVVAL
jgi:trypsin